MLKKSKVQIKTRLKKGDLVQVVSGSDSGVFSPKGADPEDVGRRGRLRSINYFTGRVIVEGVNMHKKAVKPDPNKNRPGGIIDIEGSMHISNVMIICHKCDKPVRSGLKKLANGKRIRCCRKCKANIGEEY